MTNPVAQPQSEVSVPPGSSDHDEPRLADFLARRYAVRSPLISWVVFERLGGALAFACSRLGVRPAAATLLGGALGAAGAVALATAGSPGGAVLAGTLLLVSYSLDCTDGQLARATGRTSAMGAWLDVTIDAVVLTFLTAVMAVALLAESTLPAVSALLAGAYGASRAAGLMTSSWVSSDGGGMRLTGASALARQAYTAVTDTPVTYVLLCATRLMPALFRAVIVAIALMTVVQTLVSARHHFRSRAGDA
jgi:phosphatidylglycerophosphate synthase